MANDSRHAGIQNEELLSEVERILRVEIDLARPDDLAFLESQVPHIAAKIVSRLRSLGGLAEAPEGKDQEKGDEVLRRLLKTPPDPKGGKRGASAPRPGSHEETDQNHQDPKAGG